MAIIACPGCGQRISNKYDVCPHCQCALDGSFNAPGGVEMRKRLTQQRNHRIEVLTYLSILVTVAGVAWFWADTDGMNRPAGIWSLTTLGVGSLSYILVRVYIIYTNVMSKK